MATKGKNEEISDESRAESLVGSDSASDSSDMELTESDGEDDIAIVNSAFYVDFEPGTNKILNFRAAYGGMGPTTRLAVATNSKAGI